MAISSPPSKRIKLEDEDEGPLLKSAREEEYGPEQPVPIQDEEDEMDVDHCSICLQPISDRTVIPACSHEFCFECLLVWTEQSRRCPLCSRTIGEYLIHNIRSKYDYRKHYLTPLRTSPAPGLPLARNGTRRRMTRREAAWGRRERREQAAADGLERAIEKRRWVYRHHLYAKHVASNSYTHYRPFPTPVQFAANQELITRATVFVRRELRVWDSLDVEFLTTFTISLMKSLDIRSEPAVKLLAEFLDMDAEHDGANPRTNAEHFAHELYSYLRSPFRDLSVYDSVVQYDTPPDIPPPDEASHRGRQRYPSPSRHAEPGPLSPRADSSFQAPSRRSRSYSTDPEWSKRVRREESRSTDSSRVGRYRASSRERKKEPLRPARYAKSPVERAKSSHRHRSRDRSRPRADSDMYRRRRVFPSDMREGNLKQSQQERRRYRSNTLVDRHRSRSRSAEYGGENQSPLPQDEDEKVPTSTTIGDFKGKGRAVDHVPSPPTQPPLSPDSLSLNLFHAKTQTEVQDAGRSVEDGSEPQNEGPNSQTIMGDAHAAGSTRRTQPRIRQSAWQAMQAHLASSRISNNSKPFLEQRLSQSELVVPGTSSSPSSNVATPQHHVIVSSTSQTPPSEPTWQPSSPLPPVPPTTVSGTPANIDTPQEHPRAPGMSSREIMARTRARLARFKQLSEGAVSTESNVDTAWTSELSIPLTSATHVAKVANEGTVDISGAVQSSGLVQSGLSPQGAESSSLTTEQATRSGARAGYLRAKLFSKLDDEKRVQTTSPTATGVNGHIHTQTVLPEGRSQPSMSAVSPTADRASSSRLNSTALTRRDAELMESKLRAQAQLRVKIAAAKRQVGQERANRATEG